MSPKPRPNLILEPLRQSSGSGDNSDTSSFKPRSAEGTDPETGERYTVKRYESKKAQDGDSWRHARITLKPVNTDSAPIVLTVAEEGEVQVIAECVDVLRGERDLADVTQALDIPVRAGAR